MDLVVVIANPVASQFTGGSHRDVMAALAKEYQVEAAWPSSAADASRAAEEAVADGAVIVVAMGGDGMVHHVARGLVGTGIAMAIIPTGTTNVIARLAGIPTRAVKAARLIARPPEPVSLGVARMQLGRGATETTHHALFSAGFGLDAEVVAEADRDPYRKYRFGSIHYARTAFGVGLKSFPSRRPHLRVMAGDREAEATTALLQIREVYTYFGKLPIRLSSEPPDPMTALVMERLHRHRIPRIAFNAFAGRDLDLVKGVDVWEGVKGITVEADPPVAAQADGEALGMVDTATVDWLADSLLMIAGKPTV